MRHLLFLLGTTGIFCKFNSFLFLFFFLNLIKILFIYSFVPYNPFINIVTGKDTLKKHNKVIMKFNGPGDKLIIEADTNNKHFSSIDVLSPPLFSHLSVNTTPIVTKLRCHTIGDNKFIRGETARLLKEVMI